MCAEYFAKMMGSNLYNYAYSGATVDNVSDGRSLNKIHAKTNGSKKSILPRSTLDLHQQLQTFEKKGGPVNAPDSTLYAIWIGKCVPYSAIDSRPHRHERCSGYIQASNLRCGAISDPSPHACVVLCRS
jgi:hypothetical protein